MKMVVVDFSKETLTSREVDTQQAENALGWALWGSAAYNQHWFSLPKREAVTEVR